jgi:hypothetical protein
MSKGLGRVQREIDSIFENNPNDSFTVEELYIRIYGRYRIEKRHRVAVIRAAKAVAQRHPNIVSWRAEIRGRTLLFFNHRSVMSYATTRLRLTIRLMMMLKLAGYCVSTNTILR